MHYFLSENEREQSLRLENKYTLSNVMRQWCYLIKGEAKILAVSMRPGDTPVLIPNTMVKTRSADGTILETVWESRWMPLHFSLDESERSEA